MTGANELKVRKVFRPRLVEGIKLSTILSQYARMNAECLGKQVAVFSVV